MAVKRVHRSRADPNHDFVIRRHGFFYLGELKSIGRSIDDGFHCSDLRERAGKVSTGFRREERGLPGLEDDPLPLQIRGRVCDTAILIRPFKGFGVSTYGMCKMRDHGGS